MNCDAFGMISGSVRSPLFLVVASASAIPVVTIGAFWMRCCGWLARPASRAVRAVSDGETAVLSMGGERRARQAVRAVSREPDLEWLMIDATIIRAHIHPREPAVKRGA
jgi:hypothetical protein